MPLPGEGGYIKDSGRHATLVPSSSSSLLLSSQEFSDTKVYAPQIRALLGVAAHLCQVISFEWMVALWGLVVG